MYVARTYSVFTVKGNLFIIALLITGRIFPSIYLRSKGEKGGGGRREGEGMLIRHHSLKTFNTYSLDNPGLPSDPMSKSKPASSGSKVVMPM